MTNNNRAPGTRPRIRPDWESPDIHENIERLASLGLTDEQIAHQLGVCRQTLSEKKRDYPDIADAIRRGRASGIEEVADALKQKAQAGDTSAMIFFLRSKAGWSDRTTEQEVAQAKAQLSIFYDLCKAILETDSKDIGQIKSMVSIHLDHLLVKLGKPAALDSHEAEE